MLMIILISKNQMKISAVNRHTYINRYLEANSSLNALKQAIQDTNKEMYPDTEQNIAKVTYNRLSHKSKQIYSVELVERCVKEGTGFLVISVANATTNKMYHEVERGWGSLSFLSKLMLGSKPNPKGMASLLLATHFNRARLKKIIRANDRELDIAMMVYGSLLATSLGLK